MSSNRVYLAVYDLSRGMASAMSQGILGQRIDGIWHTGVVVFSCEYYFGGGIQVAPTGVFAASSNMQPVQMLDMGNSSKTQAELQDFLRSISHRFTQETYDLINNNCNNFSDAVCTFLTGHGIPDHIVNLPRIVFSTPGGAMLRPMIEGMQNSIRQQQGTGMDPFGGNPPPRPAATAASTQSQFYTSSTHSAPAGAFESSLSQSMSSTLSHSSMQSHTHTHHSQYNSQQERLYPRSASLSAIPSVPVRAGLEEKPLVSGDSSTAGVIAKKNPQLACY